MNGATIRKSILKNIIRNAELKKVKEDSDFCGIAVLFSRHFAPCQFEIGMRSNFDKCKLDGDWTLRVSAEVGKGGGGGVKNLTSQIAFSN